MKNKKIKTKFFNYENKIIKVWDCIQEGDCWNVWLQEGDPYILIKKPAIWKVCLTDFGEDIEEIKELKKNDINFIKIDI